MLSYRHAFHAGNHADVLKHSVLSLLLEYFKQKDKPFWYIDTHAGAGAYRLDSSEARKNAEYARGIGRILAARTTLPDFLQPYVESIDALNSGADLKHYPGSPWLAAELMRATDRLRLFEMHPQDVQILNDNLQRDRRVVITQSDGFSGLKALLPPPPRRALILIDPPYELKEDYAKVVNALQDALKRFSNGTYMIWYPLLSRAEAQRLPAKLMALQLPALRIELQVEKPQGEFGMFGSGLFIVNPPWTLRAQLQTWLPQLQSLLGNADESSFVLESSGNI
ncbi:MAG TPA: 23S rRNA (adenine(2030)-N(6))-methyltransferase RlmJ [Spongiibacteraceae bacterium]|nr:23S rRNA (adenine(2030)-N(6))-methyltransferase RlmJ [Spongiibacteraceae bacterium]